VANGKDRRNTKEVALWAGVAAFSGNVVAIKALAFIGSDGDIRVGISALLTSFAVGGTVYAKERLNAARAAARDSQQPTPPSS